MTDRSADLQQAIAQATQALLDQSRTANKPGQDAPQDCMVYIGNWHASYPTTLILDPALTAVDVRIYLFLCQHAVGLAHGATPFPSYALICKRLQISKPTVVNSITRLRLTRWIAQLQQVRDTQGRFRGQVYGLADEPMALVDALGMDAGYMDLVQTAQRHADQRTRRVAQAVLAVIDEQIAAGVDPTERPNALVERQQAVAGLDRKGRFFGVSLQVLQEKTLPGLQHRAAQSSKPGVSDPGQDSLPGFLPGQNSLPGQKSPGQKTLPGRSPGQEILPGQQVVDLTGNEKTLPGAPYSTVVSNVSNVPAESEPPEKPQQELQWHDELQVIPDNQRVMLQRILVQLDPLDAQKLLDALAYRYESVQVRYAQPLYKGPVAYARSLIRQMKAGTFKEVWPGMPPAESDLGTLPRMTGSSVKPTKPVNTPTAKTPASATRSSFLYQQIELRQELQGLRQMLTRLPDDTLQAPARAGLQQQIQELETQLQALQQEQQHAS